MHLSGRKILLFGFIAVLLIAIPLTIWFLGQQTVVKQQAEASTNLSFTPESSAATPIQASVGDSIPLDIFVDPGTNLVSFVKLEIQYDSAKLATASANAFTPNNALFPRVLEGPIYSPGKIVVALSTGDSPTQAIQAKGKVATVTFKAIGATAAGATTLVTYGTNTDARSVGSNDQSSENVLSSSTPATIAIADAAVTPTIPVETVTPTVPVELTPTIAATPTVAATGSADQAPVCSALDTDKVPTGDAPFALTFTANGTDVDGTISKVTFNFGDGQVSDVTTGGGIGTATANTAISHTYSTAGTFTASALLTDNNSGVSDSASCTKTVTVTASGSASVAPTIEPTGSFVETIGVAAVIMTFILGGGLLFFLL